MTTVAEKDLPVELSPFQAVEAAYPAALQRCREALGRGLPVMVECDKELTPYFYACLRDLLRRDDRRCVYLDGRPEPDPTPPAPAAGMMGTMIAQLRDIVRGAVERLVVVLPHLDLLVTSSGGLTSEAREAIPLLYENPSVLWIGFKDPSFGVPRVIENLFPHRESILGVPRERLGHLVAQRESRKFGRELDLYRLYKHVSGLNAVRLRRLLAAIDGEDYPDDPRPAFRQLRSATLTARLSLPDLDLERDIGGYARVKLRLRREILELLQRKDGLSDAEQIARIEALVPRGMIFWGPPGTGKTLFARAVASALGAAVTVVSGPELKSRWVGESEERIRQIFVTARASAPAIIIFDELDSFATARGTYTGSGVEHSMVNQLLTEMDGFRSNEMVFVVGTTNLVESLDPALLRPGRFEFLLQIPYPDADDRRAIFKIYDRKLGLGLDQRALDFAVRRTADRLEGLDMRCSGDHIQAICRALARRRIREGIHRATAPRDIEQVLTEHLDRPELTAEEERVVATHEAGHALCALHCPHAPTVQRISVRGDLTGALGFVGYADPARRHVTTRAALLDNICVLFGGREAEAMLLDDLSIGSAQDLDRATRTAQALVEEFGLGPEELGVRCFSTERDGSTRLSEATRQTLEAGVLQVLDEQRARARQILDSRRAELEALRDMLLSHKVLDGKALAALRPAARSHPQHREDRPSRDRG